MPFSPYGLSQLLVTMAITMSLSPFRHRSYARETQGLLCAGMYTAYLYVEDDTGIMWPSLVSWALVEKHFAPLGFSLGFYRTEVQPPHRPLEILLLGLPNVYVVANLYEGLTQLSPPVRQVFGTRGSCYQIERCWLT